jgi:hypothetical protein
MDLQTSPTVHPHGMRDSYTTTIGPCRPNDAKRPHSGREDAVIALCDSDGDGNVELGHENGEEDVIVKDQGDDYNNVTIARNNGVRAIGTIGICNNGGGRTTMEVPDEDDDDDDDDDDEFDKTNDTELIGTHHVITLRMALHSMHLIDNFVH